MTDWAPKALTDPVTVAFLCPQILPQMDNWTTITRIQGDTGGGGCGIICSLFDTGGIQDEGGWVMKLILQIAFGIALGLCLIPIGCVVCTTSTIVGGGAAIVAAAKAQREAMEAKERNKPQEQKDQEAKPQLLKEQEILNPRGKKDDEERKDREAEAKELREGKEKDLIVNPNDQISRFVNPDGFTVGCIDQRIENRDLVFTIAVKNISTKVITLVKTDPFAEKPQFNSYGIKEDGNNSDTARTGTTYLIGPDFRIIEPYKLLYPGDIYNFDVRIAGLNLPITKVEFNFTFNKRTFKPEDFLLGSFLFTQVAGRLVVELRSEGNAKNLYKPFPIQLSAEEEKKKKEDEEKENKEAEVKALRKAMDQDLKDKQVKKDAAAMQVERNEKFATLAVLDKSYRDAAKKSLAAEKADMFEAAKKFKAESLKAYADWKKLKLELTGQ